MSETSEDRRFVASESDDATYSDEESLGSSFPCIHHLMDGQETSSTVSVPMGFLWAAELTGATRSAKRYRLAPLPLAWSPKMEFQWYSIWSCGNRGSARCRMSMMWARICLLRQGHVSNTRKFWMPSHYSISNAHHQPSMQYRDEYSDWSQFHLTGWQVGLSRVFFGAGYRWIKCLAKGSKIRCICFGAQLLFFEILSSLALQYCNNQNNTVVLSRDFKTHRTHLKFCVCGIHTCTSVVSPGKAILGRTLYVRFMIMNLEVRLSEFVTQLRTFKSRTSRRKFSKMLSFGILTQKKVNFVGQEMALTRHSSVSYLPDHLSI
jgi:hypothetical protein